MGPLLTCTHGGTVSEDVGAQIPDPACLSAANVVGPLRPLLTGAHGGTVSEDVWAPILDPASLSEANVVRPWGPLLTCTWWHCQ